MVLPLAAPRGDAGRFHVRGRDDTCPILRYDLRQRQVSVKLT